MHGSAGEIIGKLRANRKRFLLLAVCTVSVSFIGISGVYAQQDVSAASEAGQQVAEENPSPVIRNQEETLAFDVAAKSAWQLVSGSTQIHLWGVEEIQSNDGVFKLIALAALEKQIGSEKVSCTVKQTFDDHIAALCVNAHQEDLALFMLQQGYVSAARADIYGTKYEEPYTSAESEARQTGKGVWKALSPETGQLDDKPSRNFVIAAFMFLSAAILALGVISFFIMRGFRRVVDVQNKTMDLAIRERSLRDREKFVIASMLDSEIRENKSKIEAYLLVYEEVLKDLEDPARTPKYKKSGDIVQKQPSLSRSVFDGNTNRLDLVGQQVSSDLIHYYARIKTLPDYTELTTETSLEEARNIVRTAVGHARKLMELSEQLMKDFVSYALVKRS